MSTTEYTGINYAGRLSTNKDSATGIRYGVISQHSVNSDAANDVFTNGRDLTHENFILEVRSKLHDALEDYFSEHSYAENLPSPLSVAIDDAFDAISDDLNDNYQNDGDTSYLYEQDGYAVGTCLQSDFMITASRFFTYAQFCSPCVPGACNLDSPVSDDNTDNKCYCLGHDWFDEGKAPYEVWSVETGMRVDPA